jgi:hypothetical protein
MRTVTRLAGLVLPAFFIGCHADGTTDDPSSVVRISPATVNNDAAWALFDRSVESGYLPNGTVVQTTLGHQEQVSAIKIYGSAPYRLRVTGKDGASLGIPAIDISKLSDGWNTIETTSLVSTDTVALRFEQIGTPTKLPELELWAIEEEASGTVDLSANDLPPGFVTLLPITKSEDITPAECSTFTLDLQRAPSSFTKTYLVYEAEGIFRSFQLQRTINGLAEVGGAWLADDAAKRSYVDEFDPAAVPRQEI